MSIKLHHPEMPALNSKEIKMKKTHRLPKYLIGLIGAEVRQLDNWQTQKS